MTYDVEHFQVFICHNDFFGELSRSLAPFKIRLFVFLLLSFKSSLLALDNGPLSDVSSANIFSHSGSCLLILL